MVARNCIRPYFLFALFSTWVVSGMVVQPSQTVGQTLRWQNNVDDQENMSISSFEFGKTADGKSVTRFRCKNRNGLSFTMIDYGATMIAVETPDKNGKFSNIILKCDSVDGYEKCQSYFGCTVGRFCNRIAKGRFSIDGQEFSLATNNDPNHLHGGDKGFNRAIWKAEKILTADEIGIRFKHKSPDGDENYPGNLDVIVEYILTNNDELVVRFEASTDKATHCNLTNHNYWNLGGEDSGTILEHQLKVNADKFLAVDETLIPTGKMSDVDGTELNFTQFKSVGKDIDPLRPSAAKGYDHCFVLKDYDASLKPACVLKDPKSGRVMEIQTDQPGLQFYSGNFLDATETSGGYKQHSALCLETQKFPDTPNQKDFPTTLLKTGETYKHTTIHKFTVEK